MSEIPITKVEKVELLTDRLLLRGAVPSDAEHLYNAFKDPEAMRYWSEPPHPNLARTQKWISGMIKGPQNGVTDFIICSKENNLTPIGKIGAWSGDEIGFILDRSQWRKGLATEALNKMLPYLFNEREFESITADIDPRNEASIGILTNFGFKKERFEGKTFKVGDEWVDSLYLRLSKEQWSGQ